MRMSRHLVLASMLVGLLYLPLLGLAVLGPEPAYGQRPATTFPKISAFMRKEKARLQFADAIVERIPVRKLAIANRNKLLYSAGLIDDDRVISGRDGWLFYKQQFLLYSCGKDELFDDKIDRMFLFAEVARLSGVDYTFAIAPNKASILPEQMSSRTRLYARCYADRRRHFEQRLAANGPRNIIDHGLSLKEYSGERTKLFLARDTHWTKFGGAFALRDLAVAGHEATRRAAIAQDYSVQPVPGPLVDPDLSAGMLLLTGQEQDVAADGIEAFLSRYGAMPGRTVVIHDSFYARIAPQVAKLYQNATLVNVANMDAAQYEALVAEFLPKATRVVVSGVERSMLNRFYRGAHDWNHALSKDILARNAIAAGKCAYGKNRAAETSKAAANTALKNIKFLGDASYAPTTADPSFIVTLDEGNKELRAVCIKLRLDVSAPDVLSIYPERAGSAGKQPVYAFGNSIDIQLRTGINDIQLVVPHLAGATTLRIDPVGAKAHFKLVEISLGQPE